MLAAKLPSSFAAAFSSADPAPKFSRLLFRFQNVPLIFLRRLGFVDLDTRLSSPGVVGRIAKAEAGRSRPFWEELSGDWLS